MKVAATRNDFFSSFIAFSNCLEESEARLIFTECQIDFGIINGFFDVTNMRTMLSFADMPFQAIAQQQVKTGGYGAEYDRSLGGVISLVTKSGSNDWHFGGSVEWSPDWGRKPGKDVKTRDSHADNPLYAYRSDNEFERLTYSAYASGPIVKDKLFFFAMLEA